MRLLHPYWLWNIWIHKFSNMDLNRCTNGISQTNFKLTYTVKTPTDIIFVGNWCALLNTLQTTELAAVYFIFKTIFNIYVCCIAVIYTQSEWKGFFLLQTIYTHLIFPRFVNEVHLFLTFIRLTHSLVVVNIPNIYVAHVRLSSTGILNLYPPKWMG